MARFGLHPGVGAALGAVLLFGAGTPLAKLLLVDARPWLLAGLLYLGLGPSAWRLLRRSERRARLAPGDAVAEHCACIGDQGGVPGACRIR